MGHEVTAPTSAGQYEGAGAQVARDEKIRVERLWTPGGIPRIIVIRRQRVILDQDLAKVYGVRTAALNQAIRRNPKRFPDCFFIKH